METRIRELDIQFPLNWFCFIPWQSFRGGREKNYRWDLIYQDRSPHLWHILWSPSQGTLRQTSLLLSHSSAGLVCVQEKWCRWGEIWYRGCHASFCLAEMLVMLVLQPALAEPLALRLPWKCPLWRHLIQMIPAPWALLARGQAFLRSCIPHGIPSHTLNLASLLRLLLLSLLLVFLCLHLRREKQGDIHSRPLLYFTAGFSSAVCLLFIRAMRRY